MSTMASQITSVSTVCLSVYSGITGRCEGNPPVTCGFPSQKASNAENVSIWWRHHVSSVGNLTDELLRVQRHHDGLPTTGSCDRTQLGPRTYVLHFIHCLRESPLGLTTIGTKYNEVPLKHSQFSPNSSQETPHSSPVRASYGMSCVNTNSDLRSAPATKLLYAIPCCIGLCYNGTRLYAQTKHFLLFYCIIIYFYFIMLLICLFSPPDPVHRAVRYIRGLWLWRGRKTWLLATQSPTRRGPCATQQQLHGQWVKWFIGSWEMLVII